MLNLETFGNINELMSLIHKVKEKYYPFIAKSLSDLASIDGNISLL
jgi:hypothetical protein